MTNWQRNRGDRKALETLMSFGNPLPGEFSMDEYIAFFDGTIKYAPLKSSQGAIVFGSRLATITISDSIEYEPKVNFIKAHELGHLLLHRKPNKLYTDSYKTLSDWFINNIIEVEANSFAKQLLLPHFQFSKFISGRKFGIDLIQECADFFKTSLTSTIIRFIEIGTEPSFLLFCENGLISWTKPSYDFPLEFIPKNMPIPLASLTSDFFRSGTISQSIQGDPTNAINWFYNDFNIAKYQKWQFREFCVPISPTKCLTVLCSF